VGRERLGAPDDGVLVGLLEAEVERKWRDGELDIHDRSDFRRARQK
jgi:hypothetical protein